MAFNIIRRNIIDISAHILSALVFCTLIYLATGRLSYVAAFFTGAVLIDLDHLIDAFLFFGARFDLKDIFDSSHLNSGKVYLFLHAWELVIVLVFIGLSFDLMILTIFACGLALHLTIDSVQRKNKIFYFISYRLMKRFDVRALLPEYCENYGVRS